ncbi:type II CAAX endopeptidase family protein [Desulfosporosinus sp. PR]|uniref:CPBP family intramembrane glutamic endopeptidase n=1 Tax=Candidatus Desulfosporosinus nitrosoreducens TaxID=3401928 RepID=UPI0027EC2807|nr:type II CAAX endopeptidase family protein [Desulfosporosinus sp. PR]MDQ7095072.1 type II CAAX endopeptidase family protein [Desulfosporosinus sp. PR]
MKTLKVMSIIGIIYFLFCLLANIGLSKSDPVAAAGWGLLSIFYAIPFSIVVLIQALKKPHKAPSEPDIILANDLKEQGESPKSELGSPNRQILKVEPEEVKINEGLESQQSYEVFKRLRLRWLPIWLVISLIITLVIMGIAKVNFKNPLINNLMELIPYVLAIIWLLFKKRKLNIQLMSLIGKPPKRYKWWKLILGVLVVLLFSLGSAFVLNYCLSYWAPHFLLSHYNEPKQAYSTFNEVFKLFVAVLVAPFVEELFFRGLMLHRFSVKWNIHVAIILSSILFGILHFNFIGITMVGFIMCIVYLKTRSLIPTMIMHSLNNLLAESITLLGSNGAKTPLTIDSMRSTFWSGIVLMAMTGPFLVYYIYRNWPKKDDDLPYFAKPFSDDF